MPRDRGSPKFPTIGLHSRYRSTRAADEGEPSRNVLNGVGNFRSLLQHGGDGTVLFFREPHRVFHGFPRDLSANEIGQMNRRIDGGIAVRSLARCPYFEATKRLAFLAENSHHVRGRASA